MIQFRKGNLLQANSEALVNPVNTLGVMGKGLALAFKQAYPENFQHYQEYCRLGKLQPGEIFATETQELFGPKWIINLATKAHWKDPSKLEWIEKGLRELRAFIEAKSLKSVAIPALGCGLGGLPWPDVRKSIEARLGNLIEVDILVFEPG